MPSGVYPRTEKHWLQIRAAMDKGQYDPEVRARAVRNIRRSAKRPDFRRKMQQIALAQLQDPEARKRRLSGFQIWVSTHGPGWKGGNGREPVPIVQEAEKLLSPWGFVREFPVKTKGHITKHNPPSNYKVDFGHPEERIVIELDGPSHRKAEKRLQDRKKTEVLESLGWEVIRIIHV